MSVSERRFLQDAGVDVLYARGFVRGQRALHDSNIAFHACVAAMSRSGGAWLRND
jgi:hypothetical protein